MKLLLDTHVLLWALLEPQKLSPELRNALECNARSWNRGHKTLFALPPPWDWRECNAGY